MANLLDPRLKNALETDRIKW